MKKARYCEIPKEYRKNYKKLAATASLMAATSFVCVAIGVAIFFLGLAINH